jgi:hypothetical protein
MRLFLFFALFPSSRFKFFFTAKAAKEYERVLF